MAFHSIDFHKKMIKALCILFLIVHCYSYSVDFEDLPVFLNEPQEEMSRPEFEEFMNRFGSDYGYNGLIDDIRDTDMKRLKGAVYLDYTGAGVYRESQVQKCNDLLLNGLYGNAHSRSPSSLHTENLVFYFVPLFLNRLRMSESVSSSFLMLLLQNTLLSSQAERLEHCIL